MKTFRLIETALLAILVCVNFTACSSDTPEVEKNENGIITNQKQLMQIKMVDGHSTITWDFTYDLKDRLTSINYIEKYGNNTHTNITDYTWGNNIIISGTNDNTNKTYSLNNNLVETIHYNEDGRNLTFTYNSSNELTTFQETYKNSNSMITYTWENGKIIKNSYESGESLEYIYSGKTCKGYFPLYGLLYYDENIFYVHPELIGLRSTNLPDQLIMKNDEYKIDYAYSFDKDGYVDSCTETHTFGTSNNETMTFIYTFTWE